MVVDDKRACCVIIKIKIYKNKFSKLVIIRKMDTDEESCFSDEEGALFEDSVKPYRFEPRYSENELQVMTHANNAMIESNSTPVDISWCKCGFCVCDADIDEKVYCKTPLLLPDEEFGNLTCITQTTALANVCLDRNVLKAALGAWREFQNEALRPENKNYRFISYKQYIWWCYGYLGKNKRKPLPNCVITKIREMYPEQSDIYVPFRTGK